MKKRYLTEYFVGDQRYGGDIWARSFKEAERLADKRSIGEKVIGDGYRGGGLPRARTRLQKLHEAVYLGWIALESDRLTAEDLLGDKGIIHEFIHSMSGAKVKGLEKRFRELQRQTPGHNP